MLFIIHLQDTLHSLTIVLGRSGIDNILITRNGHKQQAVWCYLDSPNKLRGSSTPQLTSLLCIVVVSSLDVGFCFLSFSFCLACEWHFSIVYIEASPGPGLFYAPSPKQDGCHPMQLGDADRQFVGSRGYFGLLYWILSVQAIASWIGNL